MSDELKFDTMAVDTKLAQKYILERQSEFDKLLTRTTTDLESYNDDQKVHLLNEKLIHLTELIDENAQLFCQLEFLKRNIPVKETKEFDLKLIVNNLRHTEWHLHISSVFENTIIQMNDDSPLAMLGWLAQIYTYGLYHPIIQISDKTVAICYLFSELCAQAGLPQLKLCYQVNTMMMGKIKELEYGCIGIVTGRSDVDSAVNALLEGPLNKPWAVREILIEESAVESFKRALSWKTRNQTVDASIASQCTESYSYNGKLYLFEYVGEYLNGAVLINTYRTVKDLLSIIPQSLAVSLWANDVSECNEIALKLNTTIVWVNDLGNFNGSTHTAQAFYSLQGINYTTRFLKQRKHMEVLKKSQGAWLKKDAAERTALLQKILRSKIDLDNFVFVGDKFMCYDVTLPVGTVILQSSNKTLINDIAKNLVVGNAVVVDTAINSYLQEMIYKLIDENCPILCIDTFEYTSDGFQVACGGFYKKKVIWTSYGTIFAN